MKTDHPDRHQKGNSSLRWHISSDRSNGYIYRIISYTRIIEFIFLSSVHETFSRTDNMLGNKASINKFKRAEITSSIFFDYNYMITRNELI